MSRKQAPTVLLVEDNPGHARLIEKILRRSKLANNIILLSDGQQAVDYLFNREEDYHAEPYSNLLMLLDLNLPFLNGYQVLARVKGDARTKCIPVVILTTADDPQEVKTCYELGCNLYITKPIDYYKFTKAIRELGNCPSIVTLPLTQYSIVK